MKNIKVFGFIILSLFIFSCTEEDDDGGTTDPNALTTANLAGTYNVTAFSGTATETDTSGGSTDVVTAVVEGTDFNNCTFVFNSNGTLFTTGTYTSTITYTEDGMTSTEVEVTEFDLGGSYTLSGNRLILSNSDGASFVIENFSDAGMNLNFAISNTEPGYTYEAEGFITLVRQ